MLKSKTINFAILLAASGAAQINLQSVQDFIAPSTYGWLTLGIAVVVAVLRVVTTESLSEK